MLKRKMKYFISLLLSLALAVQWGGGSVLTSAAVLDNVSVAKVETLIGSPVTETEPQSLFSYLREILTTVVAMSGQLNTLGEQMTTVATNVSNLSTTAGGGCYYLFRSTRSYLNGYTVTLNDTRTKQKCIIARDDLSEDYRGSMSSPLATSVTLCLYDKNNVLQMSRAINAAQSNGSCIIDLDTYIDSEYNNILTRAKSDVDTYHLADHLIAESKYATNASYYQGICEYLIVKHDRPCNMFLSTLGIESNLNSFDTMHDGSLESNTVLCKLYDTAYASQFISRQDYCDYLLQHSAGLITILDKFKTTNQDFIQNASVLNSTLVTNKDNYSFIKTKTATAYPYSDNNEYAVYINTGTMNYASTDTFGPGWWWCDMGYSNCRGSQGTITVVETQGTMHPTISGTVSYEEFHGTQTLDGSMSAEFSVAGSTTIYTGKYNYVVTNVDMTVTVPEVCVGHGGHYCGYWGGSRGTNIFCYKRDVTLHYVDTITYPTVWYIDLL